ncbi:MAG: helix-turn-helix domain-containing protein [Campylobacterota bacterium]|nr:helix-turn-helix domain-containing protein [Campylobacterota bacterium]
MVVVVLAVAAAVDATSFLCASVASKEAFKTANLLKSLTVNALISGEHGTGKRSLARYILPDALFFNALEYDEILSALPSCESIIIYNIEHSPNSEQLFELIKQYQVRVIATTALLEVNERYEEQFSIKIPLPSLQERPEDVVMLQEHFTHEAKNIFGIEKSFDFTKLEVDISKNAYSLRRQIMMNYLLDDINENELMIIMENYLTDKMGSNNDYRNFLHLFEVPLIQAGIKRFKSQLQLSERLGLNRNTLRKKISENEPFGLKT